MVASKSSSSAYGALPSPPFARSSADKTWNSSRRCDFGSWLRQIRGRQVQNEVGSQRGHMFSGWNFLVVVGALQHVHQGNFPHYRRASLYIIAWLEKIQIKQAVAERAINNWVPFNSLCRRFGGFILDILSPIVHSSIVEVCICDWIIQILNVLNCWLMALPHALLSVVDEIMAVEPALTCKEPAAARKMTWYVVWFGARRHCASSLMILKVEAGYCATRRFGQKYYNWTYAACLYDTSNKQNSV